MFESAAAVLSRAGCSGLSNTGILTVRSTTRNTKTSNSRRSSDGLRELIRSSAIGKGTLS